MEIILDPKYISLVPLLVAFLSAIKNSGLIPSRFIPLLAMIAGLTIGFFIADGKIYDALVIGGGLALSAIGAHSGIKNSLQK